MAGLVALAVVAAVTGFVGHSAITGPEREVIRKQEEEKKRAEEEARLAALSPAELEAELASKRREEQTQVLLAGVAVLAYGWYLSKKAEKEERA